MQFVTNLTTLTAQTLNIITHLWTVIFISVTSVAGAATILLLYVLAFHAYDPATMSVMRTTLADYDISERAAL